MKIVLFVLMFCVNAQAIEPGDLPARDCPYIDGCPPSQEWQPDWQMCDEMSEEIELFYTKLDPKHRSGGEEICFLRDELEDTKFPRSKLSRKRQHTVKGIINDLCIDFELASCVDYTSGGAH